MSYQKTVWVDHIEDPNDIDPVTGKPRVVQQGTKFTATRANKIEKGISDAHTLVENLAQTAIGSAVVSGLTFTSSGLTASYTAGTAYVNGVRFDVATGNIVLNSTQGQYIYLDSDGAVKKATDQATAQAKCFLWYFATDASSVITSTDSRIIGGSSSYVHQSDVATNGANKIPRLDGQGKGSFDITGNAVSVGGQSLSQLDTRYAGINQAVRTDATTTMAKATELKKVANNDSVTYTLIDVDAKIYRAVYNDLAELFEHDEQTEPGDILISCNGKVVRSVKKHDRRTVGVHSDTFGFCLGGENRESPKDNFDRFTPVGIAGRVYVKVIGDVEEGDLIVSSDIPGVGMRSEGCIPGTVVGKALETKIGTNGVYKLWMLIMNS